MRHDSPVSHVLMAVSTTAVVGLPTFVSQARGFFPPEIAQPTFFLACSRWQSHVPCTALALPIAISNNQNIRRSRGKP